MEQMRQTAQRREKKKKEKEEKLRESLVQSRLSRASDSIVQTRTVSQVYNRASSFDTASRSLAESTDLVIVKNLDTNEQQTLEQAERETEKFDVIDVPMSLRQDFWNSYKTGLSKAEENFFEACAKGDLAQLEKILDPKSPYPVDVNILSQERRNCLHVGINCNGGTDTLRKLIVKGANINHKNQQGRTPIIVATIKGLDDLVRLLLQSKCQVDLQDIYGNTALHYSCMYNHDIIADLLVLFGASRTITNNEKLTPLEVCVNPKMLMVFDREHLKEGKSSQDYTRTIYENVMINNSRADHIHKLLSLTEKFKDTASVLEDPEGSSNPQPFKKKKSAFSRYEAMSTQIQPKEVKETSLLEFKHVDTLGKGAFGAVYLVEHEITKKRYAMKMLSKAQIEAQKLQRYALTERKILATINHPFVVKLHYAFQTYDKLIFVMDYCPGGDLLDIIKKYKKLDEQLVKKYAAEIVLALECLHKAEIIYRDLKPANVVIDKDGHACLTDFGLAKEADMTHSFCGSLAYLSPEMLSRRGHTRTLDWYLLGVLIYECYTGKPPFYDTNKSELLNNIKVGRYKPFEASAEMKDIVAKLLRSNITKRLGNESGSEQVKAHPWFQGINWDDVLQRKLQMPVPVSARDVLIEKSDRVAIFTEEEVQKGKTLNHFKDWEFQG